MTKVQNANTLLNISVNAKQPTNCSSPRGNLKAEVNGKTSAYCLIFVVSITGNFLVGVVVYKKKAMRKTINVFIVNMAMSDFIYPIFVFPAILTQLYMDRFAFGRNYRQALKDLLMGNI